MPRPVPEPALADLLDDPILHLLLERDRISHDGLLDLIDAVRERLRARTSDGMH
ncbi:hypothetical protein [Azospirillum sp. TSO22-1]|uniref:hypothetical protein n=1 Tax=Azospirillum sp. TSO22-1 TaxID=716789 RepID=UPI001304EF74|nr:hypothetical protein [Azospirillum sp. TSO22-1]